LPGIHGVDQKRLITNMVSSSNAVSVGSSSER
jgi:hypothetical protein